MSELDFKQIKVGDWVWTEQDTRRNRSDRRIREVTRLTKTLIVCDDGDEFDRFRISNGYGFSYYTRFIQIVAVATEEEVRTVGIPIKQSREAWKARRAKIDQMATCLPAGMKACTLDGTAWQIEVSIKDLSEDQVRAVATAIAKELEAQ